MKQTGTIHIKDNKVIFMYHELEKPDYDIYEKAKDFNFDYEYYKKIIEEYEASKREAEVENVFHIGDCPCNFVWILESEHISSLHDPFAGEILKDNMPCEAEITDNKVTITKIL